MNGSILVVIGLAAGTLGQTSTVTYQSTLTGNMSYPARVATIPGGGFYVTDPATAQVVEYDVANLFVTAHAVPEGPVGIAVHTDGRVFVSREDGAVGVYDAAFALLGTVDPAPMTLSEPNGMAFDGAAGELYVVDSPAAQVLVFEESVPGTWTLARSWGTYGTGMGMQAMPQAVALDMALSHVIVADADNYRLQVFDTGGNFQFKFGYRILFTPSSEMAWFARSEGVAVDTCGNIYIIDALMGTMRVFSQSGVELDPAHAAIVGFGSGAGQLRNPAGLAFDASGGLYVANTGNASVEVFSVTCTPPAFAATGVRKPVPTRQAKGARPHSVREFEVRLPDNPFDVAAAVKSGEYRPDYDINRDRVVDQADLEIVVSFFGGAEVRDFTDPMAAHPALDPPHILDLPNRCGRCHSFDGAPDGMLTAAGQENLCLSCHSAGKIAGHHSIPGIDTGLIHPMDESASPDPGSDLWDHLDGDKIRCGTCHEPHETMGLSTYVRAPGEAINLCGKCHEEWDQWLLAGHSDADSRAFGYPTGPGREACAKCHTGGGYIDFSNGVPEAERSTTKRVHDCLVCHATHGKHHDEDLLRIFDDVTLPGDVTLTNKGVSATCMTCHNGRRVPSDGGTPHYALGGVMLEGINGVEFKACVGGTQDGERCFEDADCDSNVCGSNYTFLHNTAHRDNLTCASCHMAASPAAGDPGAGKVGGHTFSLKVHDPDDPDFGFENVSIVCTSCHPGLTTLNRDIGNDYDGDGAAEGIQVETQDLLDLLFADILGTGAVYLGHYPYWDYSGVPPVNEQLVKDCVWNYEYVDNSGDLGVKNAGYAVGLLQVSIIELRAVFGGDPIPPWTPKFTP